MQDTGWLYGGSDELFPNLTWETHPSMAGSEASEICRAHGWRPSWRSSTCWAPSRTVTAS
jgi:hypothetical protein